MDELAGMSLGARIRKLRGEPTLITQRELADAAGISVDVIRKLEQGSRHTTSIATLHRIARALGVDIATLFGQPSSDSDKGTMTILQALARVDDLLDEIMLDGEPVDLREARRVANYTWGLYWSGRLEQLGTLLPQAIAQLRATAHAARSDDRVAAARATRPLLLGHRLCPRPIRPAGGGGAGDPGGAAGLRAWG